MVNQELLSAQDQALNDYVVIDTDSMIEYIERRNYPKISRETIQKVIDTQEEVMAQAGLLIRTKDVSQQLKFLYRASEEVHSVRMPNNCVEIYIAP